MNDPEQSELPPHKHMYLPPNQIPKRLLHQPLHHILNNSKGYNKELKEQRYPFLIEVCGYQMDNINKKHETSPIKIIFPQLKDNWP